MQSTPLNPAPDANHTLHASLTDSSEWLYEVRHFALDGSPVEYRTAADTESFLLVLGGTHDLYAGGGSWVRRGLRKSPLEGGRPVGVFLPPSTPIKLENGEGSALVLSVRQPKLPEPETPKESLSKKPLLQMSGSGKAFDPASGTWKPKEAFLESPEAILPRRIERLQTADGEPIVQRILDTDYKALGLCVDEVALAAGQSVEIPEHKAVAGTSLPPRDVAIYFDCEGSLAIEGGDVASTHTGRGVCTLRGMSTAAGQQPRLRATDGRAYAAIVYGGPKA